MFQRLINLPSRAASSGPYAAPRNAPRNCRPNIPDFASTRAETGVNNRERNFVAPPRISRLAANKTKTRVAKDVNFRRGRHVARRASARCRGNKAINVNV